MNFGKTLELTSDQLKKLNLKYGKNEIRYEVFTMLQEIFKIFGILTPGNGIQNAGPLSSAFSRN